MTKTTLPVFQKTLEKTEEWLSEIMNQLDWDDQQRAYRALRIVLHTLRDCLSVEEATDLSAQLPMLVRGIFFEGWNPGHKHEKIRTATEFTDAVNKHFEKANLEYYLEAGDISRAVFRVLANHFSAGEVKDVIHTLPESLRELWD
jgi:uncharacterized protein (DUF2267 family)